MGWRRLRRRCRLPSVGPACHQRRPIISRTTRCLSCFRFSSCSSCKVYRCTFWIRIENIIVTTNVTVLKIIPFPVRIQKECPVDSQKLLGLLMFSCWEGKSFVGADGRGLLFVDIYLGVPPCILTAMPVLPHLQLPQLNWTIS